MNIRKIARPPEASQSGFFSWKNKFGSSDSIFILSYSLQGSSLSPRLSSRIATLFFKKKEKEFFSFFTLHLQHNRITKTCVPIQPSVRLCCIQVEQNRRKQVWKALRLIFLIQNELVFRSFASCCDIFTIVVVCWYLFENKHPIIQLQLGTLMFFCE